LPVLALAVERIFIDPHNGAVTQGPLRLAQNLLHDDQRHGVAETLKTSVAVIRSRAQKRHKSPRGERRPLFTYPYKV
jgi:hypothetical protein